MTRATRKYKVEQKNFVAFIHVVRPGGQDDESIILGELDELLENMNGLASISVQNGVSTKPETKRVLQSAIGDEKRRGKRRTWVAEHSSFDKQNNPIIVKGHYKWYPTKHKKHVSRKIGQPVERPNGKTWITGSQYTKANGTRVTVPGHWRPLPAGYRARLKGPGVPSGTTVRHSLDA